MAVTTTITKPLENGYLQVDAKYKSGYKRYYKVPQKNAKKFANEFSAKDKNLNLYSNIVFWGSILVGVAASAFFTKNMESRMKQFLIQTTSAIGFTGLTSYVMSLYSRNEQENLVNKYQAKEIFYRA